MPYDASEGRVYAPLSVASVAQALGETSTDVGSLCCSSKINEASLIRPQYYRDTTGTNPQRGIELLTNISDMTLVVPPAKMGEVYAGASGFDCISDEYDFPSGLHYAYQHMKWGYLVPYVGSPAAIFMLRDLWWHRYGPKDGAWITGANGYKIVTDTWCGLHHFDGYRTDAKMVKMMQNVVLAYGQKPTYTPVLASGAWKDEDILNLEEGEAHTGGSVSVPSVFSGKSMIYGATLFRKANGRYSFVRHSLGGSTDNTGFLTPVVMDFRLTDAPQGCVLVPWVTSSDVTLGAGGLTLNYPSGTRFYGLNYSESFSNYAEVTDPIEPKTFKISNVSMSESSNVYHVKFRLINNRYNYPLSAMIRYVKYNAGSAVEQTTAFSYAEGAQNIEIGIVYTPPTSGSPGGTSGAMYQDYDLYFTYSGSATMSSIIVDIYAMDRNYTNAISAPQRISTTTSGEIASPDSPIIG